MTVPVGRRVDRGHPADPEDLFECPFVGDALAETRARVVLLLGGVTVGRQRHPTSQDGTTEPPGTTALDLEIATRAAQ